MIAATGGHLMQLTRLEQRLALAGDPLWVTFDSPQSRSLLHGRDCEFVRHTAPRDYANVLRNLKPAREILSAHNVVEVVSTGSAVALSFLPLARAMGIPAHYIESAARSDGPSVTGKLLAHVPGVSVHTQYRSWASHRWQLVPGVFDSFEVDEPRTEEPSGTRSLVVALGTLEYRFDRLVDAVSAAVPDGWTVTWQVADNTYVPATGDVRSMLSAQDFAELCRNADVVVAHAGVGTALTAIEAGRIPILVPRRKEFGEHVDNHQLMIGTELSRRGLARVIEPSDLDPGRLLEMVGLRARRVARPAKVAL